MTTSEPPVLYCGPHKAATYLRCNKCETPICPRCSVQTPLGARCRSCANLQRSPIYRLSWQHYARAIGAGLALAVAGGLVWTFLPFRGFLVLLLGWGFGLAIAEGISRSTNLKRGLPLQLISAGSVLVAAGIFVFLNGPARFDLLDLLAAVLAIAIAAGRLA